VGDQDVFAGGRAKSIRARIEVQVGKRDDDTMWADGKPALPAMVSISSGE
jgi:hypothetical protein